MSLLDTAINLIAKGRKEPLTGSRSEREAKIKDKAGLVINVFAALLAFNTFIGGQLSSTVMNNTIKANDLWNFYQAKSIKQTQYEVAAVTNPAQAKQLSDKAASYETGPDGKQELYAAARQLEAERDVAKRKSPWIGYASTAYQLAIVLLSASILAVRMELFWASFLVAGTGIALMLQGLWLLF
jgi:hypothetical protein